MGGERGWGGRVSTSLFPSPSFPSPFISAVCRLPLETSACPPPLPPLLSTSPLPSWGCRARAPLDLPSSPSLWPHCLARAEPPEWNRWTDTRARVPGKAGPAGAGKEERLGENKTEGGAGEEAAGAGEKVARSRGGGPSQRGAKAWNGMGAGPRVGALGPGAQSRP